MSSLAMGALLPVVAAAQTVPGGGIGQSAHNFADYGDPPSGLCTFCHTPHKAQVQALLWNHKLSANTFTWSDPTTTAGTVYPSFKGDTYKGGTAKCLSCHDGSVAVGDVGWWAGGPANLDPTKLTGAFQTASATGSMTGNHPVAMPYPYLGAVNTYNGVKNGPATKLTDWLADPQTVGIALYNDDGSGNISGGAVAGKSGIECSSCHDPHNGSSVQDQYLLLGTLGGSNSGTNGYICLKCHVK